ncbi:putative reverse transcriptase domain-containing protein [Tanacetum coccineum]
MPPRRFKKKSVKGIVEKLLKNIKRQELTQTILVDLDQQLLEELLHHMCIDVCTFEGRALTWWNGNVQTLGLANANRIPWNEFKSMITTEYCPTTEIQRMEQELWTLTLKGDDIEGYNNRFHKLALMCPGLVAPERKKIERFIRGLPEKVKANVTSSKPASLHEAINMARELVEQAIQAKAARIGESNKRRWEEHQGSNSNHNHNIYHQQQNMRQKGAKAYTTAPAERKGYLGTRPLCN